MQIKAEIIESLVLNGDLSKLNPKQKVEYYNAFCARLGLDPATQPFKILKLNGKEVLYCDRSGAQQLNKKYEVSHQIVSRDYVESAGVYQVTARASIGARFTDSIGAVNIQGLKGDAYANAIMKAETKAKRRATLDLLGLGMLDETETDSIPNAQTLEVKQEATNTQIGMIEQLLQRANITEPQFEKISSEFESYDIERAAKCIEFLKENQPPTLNQQFEQALKNDED